MFSLNEWYLEDNNNTDDGVFQFLKFAQTIQFLSTPANPLLAETVPIVRHKETDLSVAAPSVSKEIHSLAAQKPNV